MIPMMINIKVKKILRKKGKRRNIENEKRIEN